MPPDPPVGMPPPPPGIPPAPPPELPDPPGGSFNPNVQAAPSARSSEDSLMLVLSYLSLLALIPYFSSKNADVRWHAKQGLTLAGVFFVFRIATWLPLVGWIAAMLYPIVSLLYFVLVVVGIVKALGGDRWRIPLIADVAEKW
jgi:uncharacterized membrane protein